MIHLLPCGVILVLANLSAPTEEGECGTHCNEGSEEPGGPGRWKSPRWVWWVFTLSFFLETKLTPVYYMCMDGWVHEEYGFSKWYNWFIDCWEYTPLRELKPPRTTKLWYSDMSVAPMGQSLRLVIWRLTAESVHFLLPTKSDWGLFIDEL